MAVACLAGALILLVGCAVPRNAAPVVKLGLIAPFEGTDRPLGYAVLPVVKAAIATANREGRLGPYRVALVALNDDSDPRGAAAQAGALAADPDVLAVLGPWTASAARAAGPALESAGLPAVVAAPYVGQGGVVRSLCPPPSAVAAALVAAARRLGAAPLAIAGSDERLAEAASAHLGGAFRVPLHAGSPCPPSVGDSSRNDCVVLYSGDALGLAADLERWRLNGWKGTVLAGPDVAMPWFPARAGDNGDGVRALLCTASGRAPAAGEGVAASHAGLAVLGSELLLEAIRRDIAASGTPSRRGVAAALTQMDAHIGLGWVEVRQGAWTSVTPQAPAP